MMKKLLLLVILTVLLGIKLNAQGDSVANSEAFCSGGGELVFNNITGSPNSTTVGCLGTIPNAAYYFLETDRPGDLVFTISQTDLGGTPIDVDFIAWGPFASIAAADAAINLAPCTPIACPDNTIDPTFYPYASDDIVDCSYDPAPIENLSITNAMAGEIYIVLITNYDDVPGNISIQQTFGTGSTSCSGIPVCGSGFYDKAGQTTDYANNEVNDITTIFPDVAGGIVTVTFNSFDLVDAGDTLAVYDGDSATTLIGTYSGTTIPGPFTSTDPSGALTFVFNSNASGVASGWDADVTCTEPPPTLVCGTTFTDSGGIGSDYSNDEYNITTFYPDTAGEVITVTFTSFDIEPFDPFFGFFDYMAVYDGPNTLASSLIGRFAGTELALSSFTSTHPTGALTFLFVSDSSLVYPGWTADVTCGIPTSDCGISFYDTGGSVGDYLNDQFHVSTFYPDSPGDLVTATFNAFNIENTYDFLYVFDGPNQFSTQVVGSPFTGNTIPGPFTSTHASGALTFVFISDFSNTLSGWEVDITCSNPLDICGTTFYDDGGTGSYTNSPTSTTTLLPDNPGDIITVTFVSFNTRNNDYLYVYDGPDATYPLIDTLSGNLGIPPGPYTSTDASGALTFVFVNNQVNQVRPGWEANITCSTSACDLSIRDIPNGASCNPIYTELTVSDNVVFSENFDAFGTPSGWTIDNGPNNTEWYVSNSSNAVGDANEFILAWLRGNRNSNGTWSLTSPVININGLTNLELSYYQFLEDFDFTNYPYSIFIETSLDSGPWIAQSSMTPTGDVGPNIPNIDLSSLSGTTLQIRFRMTGMPYGFFNWAIDNVLVTGDGPPSGGQITWSPITDLFTNASLTTVYSGGFAETVFAAPNSTTTYTATDSSNSCTATADVIIDLKTWIGGDTTAPNTDPVDWMNAGNWSGGTIPSATDCVLIPNTSNNPILYSGDNGTSLNLTINAGGILNQESNSTLTVVNNILVSTGGNYNMEDSASLIQVDNVANTVDGTFTMQRTANIIENDYVYWSSPVTTFNIEAISPGTPNGYKYRWLPTVGSRFPGPAPDFVPNDYGDWQSANTGPMNVGKGYIVKGPTGFGSTLAPFTATFSGTPNNGSITQAIERGTYTGTPYTYIPNGSATLTVTSDDDNWNLIGNPYPSALHCIDFLSANTNVDGTAYIWTHGTDIGAGNGQSFYDEFTYSYSGADYLAVNATGNSIPETYKGFIGAGQGFFVLMMDTGLPNQVVTFENTMRNFDYRNDQFFRNTATSDEGSHTKHRIWLDYINPSGGTNTTLVGYIDGATNLKDRMFDAKTTRGDGLNLYSMINDDAYIIQGRQTPFVDSDTVPLGLNITEAGIQTIAINTLDGLFQDTDQQIYIEDLVTGMIHNLNNAPYTFTSDTGEIEDRFILRYTASTLGVKDFESLNGIKVFKENDKIVVKSDFETIQSIEVYDLLGRNLFKNSSINMTRYTIEAISPEKVTLFLKIKLVDGQQKIAKFIF
ncbi:CUB domain-containing protein [Winogradskyella forsetii]|uniref:CUB domain-containing protein n=1 Tax=Winogradskyella forsetii TaxID=2686077 RepID=UPI0015B97A85|nr:CUB domain-containing protein [Winogradskyella forsetii]